MRVPAWYGLEIGRVGGTVRVVLKSRRPISSWAVLLLVAASLTDGRAADCDQDGVEDLKAIAAGTADDCNSNGIPDVCEFVPVPFSALNDSLLLDTAPFAVVIEDVTGDGRLDLVVAAERRFANPAEIQVFPNLGGTEFDTGRPFDPGENLNSLTAADLDGDGDIDFATTDDGGVVRVMKNDGAGFFSAPTETLLPAFATSLIASDLDGDGAQDLAAVHPVLGAVSLLLNRSNDEFLLVTRDVGKRPEALTVADFDQDGQPDLAVVAAGSDRVEVLFAPATAATAPLELAVDPLLRPPVLLRSVAAADFDQDGAMDLVATGFKGLFVWSGDGAGGFSEPVHTSGPLERLKLGDFDGDGAVDAMAGDYSGSDFFLFRNRNGTLLAQPPFSFDSIGLAVGDLDDDGDLDLAVPATAPNRVTVLWSGESALQLIESRQAPFGRPHFVATADLNGDGHIDVITSNAGDRTYSLLFGRGDGSFETARLRSSKRGGLVAVGVADFDEDGTVDVVFREAASLSFLPNTDGSGDFPEWNDVPTHGSGRYLIVEDLDGDGHQDVAAPDFGGNMLSVHFNDTTRTLGTRQDLPVGNLPWEVAAADFDGDGILDLVTANGNSSDLSLLLQRQGRVFEPPTTIPVEGSPHGVVGIDADRDGDMDLAVANQASQDIAVFLNQGGATFGAPRRFPLGRQPYAIHAAELDGDGVLDLIATNERTSSISILRGRGGGAYSTPQQFQVSSGPRLTIGEDLDRDGDTDLVVASRSGTQLSLLINNSAAGESTVDSLPRICTNLELFMVSADGGSPPVRSVTHYFLPVRDAPELLATAFPNAARFGDSRQFLLEAFPEDFPSLTESEYSTLVGRRASRQYFAGSIRSLTTAAGTVYGVDIVTAPAAPDELLTAAETGIVLTRLADFFLLGSLVYAPGTPAAREAASLWTAQDFEVVLLDDEEPVEPPGVPTFELVLPGGTLCAVFGVGDANRGPAEELELKSTVRLRAGTIALPTLEDRFEAELFEEVLVGPDGLVAVPQGRGEFVVGRIPGVDDTTYRFTYAQSFALPDGRDFGLSIVSPLLYHARGDEPIQFSAGLPIQFFTALKGRESLQATVEGVPLIRYGSCDYPDLSEWNVEFQLDDGTRWALRERFDEAASLFDTAPAAVVRAELTDGDLRTTTTDYFRLIYSALRHNTEIRYWIVLDPPQPLGAEPTPVRIVELLATDAEFRPQPSALYRGVDLQPLRPVGVVKFSREERRPTDFRRGDADASGSLSIADAVVVLDFVFAGTTLACRQAADANADNRINLLDAIVILEHLFRRRPLPSPTPECGLDPNPDELGCEKFFGC